MDDTDNGSKTPEEMNGISRSLSDPQNISKSAMSNSMDTLKRALETTGGSRINAQEFNAKALPANPANYGR